MKIKQQPEDFQVEELTEVRPEAKGPFAFYRLEKTGWTTPDALQTVCRRWKLDQRRLSYGGLKDRHARTVQYLTIYRGPQRNLTHQRIALTYLGQAAAAYCSTDIQANRFHLVLRDLSEGQIAHARQALAEIGRDGVPNYFDDQRFGSVSPGGEFVAKAIVRGDYERALRLALTAPYDFDRAAQKKEKAILRAHWGDWATVKDRLPRGHAHTLAEYLIRQPGDYRGAVARLRPELRGLYLAAYQSHLWNRMLANWLRERLRPEQLGAVRLRLGDVPMYRELDESQRTELGTLQLPLPSGRVALEDSDPRKKLLDGVLHEEGLEQGQLKLKGFREMFFSKGERAGLCVPTVVEYQSEQDDLSPDRQKLLLSFELPRGSYATLIIKRITQGH
jgi:tRNA pseudouridine13 synthase